MLIHTLSKSNCEFSKRKISQLLDETMKLIRKEVKKNKKFYYPTFGTFSLRSRKARTGRNPQTGETPSAFPNASSIAHVRHDH